MAPGLILSLSPDEGRKRLWDAAQYDSQASASSTAVSSSQTSPLFHPVDADARGKHGAPNFGTTQDTADLPPLMGDGVVEELKQALAISGEQSRRFDEIICKWEEACQMPRFTRAYSDGSLPAPRAESDCSTTTTKDTLYRGKNYQATVEDCTDAEDNGCTPRSSRSGSSPPSRPGSEEPNSDRGHEQRRRVFPVSAPTSPTAIPALMREHTAPAAVPPVKEVRFSDRVPVVLQRRSSARDARYTGTNTPARANMRLPRETSPSPLDAKWGKLFRSRGEPTRRLANVLRGLALYLTEVYKPTYSLVLTPDKLYKFYCKYRLDKESIDLARLFTPTSREAMRALEALYLDIQCDYHLVQDSSPGTKERPYIPALTLEGFVQWMIVIIRAFPDQEASRLCRVIADLPLEAVPEDPEDESGARERLPRQISKHLFPSQPNEGALQLVTEAIRAWKQSLGTERQPPPLSRCASSTARSNTGQNLAPPLIHSDPKSREEHLSRDRRDRDSDVVVEVPRAKRSTLDRRATDAGDNRSSRYAKSHSRQESPRRSKRFERDDSREPERGMYRKDRRWTMDGSEGTRYRKRDGRGSRV